VPATIGRVRDALQQPPLQQMDDPHARLEEETALANIALDLLGQPACCSRAPGTNPRPHRGISSPSFRDEGEFRNVRLVERPDEDFRRTGNPVADLQQLAARDLRGA